ncbi:MAG: hypothetical protein ABSG81_10955 [Acidimicrobiales bacterium]|jgi:hypothetical protein
MNPGAGLPSARARQADLRSLSGARPMRAPRRRRTTGVVSRRLGLALVHVGWRLLGPDELAERVLISSPGR